MVATGNIFWKSEYLIFDSLNLIFDSLNLKCPSRCIHTELIAMVLINLSWWFCRHGKKLKHSNQPLLRVKHAKWPRNFLAKHQEKAMEKEGPFVELPPELCLNLDVPSSFMRSLCLLPSVMHRLNCLMLTGQLIKTIKTERPNCPPISMQLVISLLIISNWCYFVWFIYLRLIVSLLFFYAEVNSS